MAAKKTRSAQDLVEVCLDCSPDRWGQMLMDRREAMMARDEKRQARKL